MVTSPRICFGYLQKIYERSLEAKRGEHESSFSGRIILIRNGYNFPVYDAFYFGLRGAYGKEIAGIRPRISVMASVPLSRVDAERLEKMLDEESKAGLKDKRTNVTTAEMNGTPHLKYQISREEPLIDFLNQAGTRRLENGRTAAALQQNRIENVPFCSVSFEELSIVFPKGSCTRRRYCQLNKEADFATSGYLMTPQEVSAVQFENDHMEEICSLVRIIRQVVPHIKI